MTKRLDNKMDIETVSPETKIKITLTIEEAKWLKDIARDYKAVDESEPSASYIARQNIVNALTNIMATLA